MSRLLRHRGPDDEGYLAVDTQGEEMRLQCSVARTVRKQEEPLLQNFLLLRIYIWDTDDWRFWIALPLVVSPCDTRTTLDRFQWRNLQLRRTATRASDRRIPFKTGTDTEVILAAYDCWGEACVTRFNGDWAFCILDTKRKMLFLSRDRYGVKPLYVFRQEIILRLHQRLKPFWLYHS